MHRDTTFEQLMDVYFSHKLLRPTTQWSYQKVVRGLIQFLNQKNVSTNPNDINKEILLEWRSFLLMKQKRERTTWNNKVAHLRALFNFGIEMNYLTHTNNPCNNLVVRPNKKKKKTLSHSQVNIIRTTMVMFSEQERLGKVNYRSECALTPTWFWIIVLDTFYYTGIRLNQLLRLRICDINIDEQYLNLCSESSKNHNEYKIPIVSQLITSLSFLIDQSLPLNPNIKEPLFNLMRFSNDYKPPETDEELAQISMTMLTYTRSFFRRLSKECHFEVTPHRFRHTIATQMMLSPDRNLQVVKTLLGHSSIQSTLEYIDNSADSIRHILEEETHKMDNNVRKNMKSKNKY